MPPPMACSSSEKKSTSRKMMMYSFGRIGEVCAPSNGINLESTTYMPAVVKAGAVPTLA